MVTVKNKVLRNLISFKLSKEDMPITEEEASMIKDIVLDNYEIEDSFELLDLRELEFFPNLETLTLIHFDFDNEDIQILGKLKNLKDITFEACTFQNPVLIASLKVESLSLLKNEINDYSFVYIMDTLKELRINKGLIDLQKCNFLTRLESLNGSYSTIEGNPSNMKFPFLKSLSIDHTNLLDLSFVLNIPHLKELSISDEQYQKNKSIIPLLKEKNITILEDGIEEFVEEGVD